ncbi:hypothetical protein DFH01_19140 [Falsiroseomonas bella]|uniref:DUF4334 domain-containing protein n=1 Tax=Falsiroseomonas bella TaxID=2184016 RepID=A0A317F9G3_9PROT|nr:DUF4334 domain-containing protein [Falsiroseomonas bella]PWS35704.1 hypothetical protein DFH01_19140 [Falsiroseomonas bella]
MIGAAARAWAVIAARGGTGEELLAVFDALPPVSVAEVLGRWRGRVLASGHPWDGLLERFGWHGKAFDGPEEAHPLLCRSRGGKLFALNPSLVPVPLLRRYPGLLGGPVAGRLFGLAGRAAATRRPAARLRMVEHRGVVSAAMIYDDLPIIDAFRGVDADTLLGVMDMRGMPQPFFFVLRRE